MKTVSLNFQSTKSVVKIEPGILTEKFSSSTDLSGKSVALISDDVVFDLYGNKVLEQLKGSGSSVVQSIQPAGESNKNLDTVAHHHSVLAEAGLERSSVLVALGGGVVGDTGGFVAATFLRGIRFIQCPTTLLAMVDASVGGKTGVNLAHGKNLVGSFYQPETVLIDPLVLKTLPAPEFVAGLAECVKHALIADEKLFSWISDNAQAILSRTDVDILSELIERNVQIKADVVQKDEREGNIRAFLNLGHTFAHAIETATNYNTFLHGQAVSLGLVAAAKLSENLGKTDSALTKQLSSLLEELGLPVSAKLPQSADLYELMKKDKKVKDGKIRFVLLEGFRKPVIESEIKKAEVVSAFDFISK